ncbi:hypothetical protein [Paenibacillus sp. UNC451MF]|uniref:hypothetical protein n=1 Tax=Paenibacillus sp. UNC451MF TaxID=1449063 RepID=UPI00048EDAEB|nr:hypothetical protein [Paenibacillus sp. UNC451MF]
MNSIFMVFLLIIMVITFLFDLRKLRSQKKPLRGLYYCIFAVTFAIYLSTLMGIKIPMPTGFFIHKVSPWVYSIVQR